MGGTGANHIMLGTGDAIWFSDGNGNPAVPPHNQTVFGIGAVDEIENPNAVPGTNNWYTEDGYGGGSGTAASPWHGGGSYSECADPTAPGVAAVLAYLSSLPRLVPPNCEPGHYYILNNYNPGYYGDGTNAYADHSSSNTVFTVPPSSVRNIGDALLEKKVSFAYYGDQFNNYLRDRYAYSPDGFEYCNICNFFQYSTSIMTDAAVRTKVLKDTVDLYADLAKGALPAVSFVKPSGLVNGHPVSSKLDLFEGFVKKIVDAVKASPDLWKSTAIFVTFDEGGGYYDAGYVQPLDFFGDGHPHPAHRRVALDQAWAHPARLWRSRVDPEVHRAQLEPITSRSRDNLPDPVYGPGSAYVPVNGPAIGDLFGLFDFRREQRAAGDAE